MTALPLLLPAERPKWFDRAKAVEWLLQQSGRESGFWFRLRQLLLGIPSEERTSYAGWPFYPGTAAWVAPTALTILALEKHLGDPRSREVRARLEVGREYLLAKQCHDGGWNYGSARVLGYAANSYPETTGLALLALHGVSPARLGGSLRFAEGVYRECRSAEGLAWLRLALLAHGRQPGSCPGEPRRRTVVEMALWVLAEAAAGGRSLLVN